MYIGVGVYTCVDDAVSLQPGLLDLSRLHYSIG